MGFVVADGVSKGTVDGGDRRKKIFLHSYHVGDLTLKRY